jgi:Calpain family cysteine protease
LVYFFINGVRRAVIVDDYLPCKFKKPVFAKSRDEELWVNLLEKAWAKLHGNYQRIVSGWPCHASCHVAGVPSRSVRHKEIDADEFKNLIKFCDKAEYTMIAATYGQGENVDDSGIVAGHAYSLISYIEVMDNGQPVSLVKLRNPWGRGEWKGDWSDGSSKWTPALKKQVGFEDRNDGLFFMNINDYKEKFAVTSLCLTNDPKYQHSNVYE